MEVRLQDHIIAATRAAMTEAFRYAKAVPSDKIDWKPLEAGRSVMELARELAKCADWGMEALSGNMELEPDATTADEMGSWGTITECEAAADEKLSRFYAYIAEYPDNRLAETIDLPFDEGGTIRTFTMAEMMDYPRWNAAYHQGQIAYIQTLYGDRGIH